jgi:hypothetical protein
MKNNTTLKARAIYVGPKIDYRNNNGAGLFLHYGMTGDATPMLFYSGYWSFDTDSGDSNIIIAESHLYFPVI